MGRNLFPYSVSRGDISSNGDFVSGKTLFRDTGAKNRSTACLVAGDLRTRVYIYKSVLLELSSRQNIEINRVTYLINIATYSWGAAGLWAQEMEMRASIT